MDIPVNDSKYAPPSDPPQPAKDRFEWMDTARGLGVLLIVYVHAGSFYSEIFHQDVPHFVRVLDLALAPYRIPLLIFLSGIFLSHSLRKGVLQFTSGKVRNILWPYLVWTAIISFTQSGLVAWLDWKTWALGGTALWYLWFLMFYYGVGLVTARIPVLIIAAYALALSMVAPAEFRYGSRLFLLMSYFFVGAFVGQHMDRMLAVVRSRWTLALVPLVIAVSAYATTQESGIKYNPYYAALLLFCIVAVCALLHHLTGPVVRALNFVGRNSIKYYVIHPAVYFVIYQQILTGSDVPIYAAMFAAIGTALLIATLVCHLIPRFPALNLLFQGPGLPATGWVSKLAQLGDRLLLPARFTLRESGTR